MTTKSWSLFHKYGKLTFEVDKNANRAVVREAVEKIWNVKVDKVNIVVKPSKVGRSGRARYERSAQKRAIIKLKPGYKIELPGIEGLYSAPVSEQASSEHMATE